MKHYFFCGFYRCVNFGESNKSFGLYSVCESFAGVYTSMKFTKIKFIPKKVFFFFFFFFFFFLQFCYHF